METSPLTAPTSYAGRHRSVDSRAPHVAGYEVVGPLARGGSGTVWSATDVSGDAVVLKVVPAADSEDALVELAVLGRLTDPHLVRLREAVALPSGEVALVMDHLAGGTLGSVVRARGHLAPGEVVTALSPIASTLARLHDVGVVHGDVSPDNVLLDGDGRPFLADLGVARIAGERLAEIRGTDGFVAPEVVLGVPPSAASDVHALGALAWFCLTGAPPDLAAVRGRLAEVVPGLPAAVVAAVEGALRIRPEDRPSADALALALFEGAPAEPITPAAGGDDVSLLTRRIRAAARAETATSEAGRGGWQSVRLRPVRRWGQRPSAWSRWATGAGVAVLLAVAGVWWAGGPGAASPGTPAAVATAGPSPTQPLDARLAADAPVRDPVGLVQALADARARAWETGIAARLVEVDAPGSPSLARDTEALATVQRAQQRYVGLAFAVREATVLTRGDGAATVRTRIDTGAHVVRGPGGEEPRVATSGGAVLLDLVRTSSGWRVRDVRTPAPSNS